MEDTAQLLERLERELKEAEARLAQRLALEEASLPDLERALERGQRRAAELTEAVARENQVQVDGVARRDALRRGREGAVERWTALGWAAVSLGLVLAIVGGALTCGLPPFMALLSAVGWLVAGYAVGFVSRR